MAGSTICCGLTLVLLCGILELLPRTEAVKYVVIEPGIIVAVNENTTSTIQPTTRTSPPEVNTLIPDIFGGRPVTTRPPITTRGPTTRPPTTRPYRTTRFPTTRPPRGGVPTTTYPKLEASSTTTPRSPAGTTRPTVQPPTPPTPPTLAPRPPSVADKACSENSVAQCNATNSERCVLVQERAWRCRCMSGYARKLGGTECVAVKYYNARLATKVKYNPDFADKSSASYRKMEFGAREGLFQAVQNSNLRSISHNINIRHVDSDAKDNARIYFELILSRSYAPDPLMVSLDLANGILTTSQVRLDKLYLDGTDIELDRQVIQHLTVTAPSPCSTPVQNYCSVHADCQDTRRSFTCTCKEGFDDVSIDKMKAPGEKCLLQCGCENNGMCKYDDNGQKFCECPLWYLGEKCSIDGKLILVIVAIALCILLLIGLICCICCLAKARDRKHKSKLAEKQNGRKVPPHWVESWRYKDGYYPDSKAPPPQQLMVPPALAAAYSSREPLDGDEDVIYPTMALRLARSDAGSQDQERGFYYPEQWFWQTSNQ